MDFDLQTLHPTYKLLLNQVGASRALWIAEKSGMPENVLSEAKAFLNTGIFPLKQANLKFKNKPKKIKSLPSFKKGDRIKVPEHHHQEEPPQRRKCPCGCEDGQSRPLPQPIDQCKPAHREPPQQ